MQPNLAQVLNTLAHEIRTPLAVSQGYLKLYVDGRLTTPDDQRRALQQTREALGVIAALCVEMSKVSALADAGTPTLVERMDAGRLLEELKAASELAGATWSEGDAVAGRIATNAPADVVRAAMVAIKVAFDDEKNVPHTIDVKAPGDALVIRAGSQAGLAALPSAPGGPGAVPVNVVRGGKGLSLIWATFVFGQHDIQAWSHKDHKGSVGLRIPLENI
jgi:signal transduction histidine kinase